MGSEGVGELPAIAPIRTTDKASSEGVGEECHTPKSEDHKIKPLLVCPPAPRKRRPAKRKLEPPPQGFFPVPRDLTSIFISLAPPPPPLKKIRAGERFEEEKPHVLEMDRSVGEEEKACKFIEIMKMPGGQ